MSCSPAEIERKRQEALKKLAQKKESPIKSVSNTHQASGITSGSTLNKFLQGSSFKKNPYDKVSPIPSKVPTRASVPFYGPNKPIVTTIGLVSSSNFCVKMSTFSPHVIETLKTVPSKIYDPKTRIWSFHIKDYDQVITKLSMLKSHNVVVEGLPKFVLKCLRCETFVDDLNIEQIDPILSQTLLPFQVDGLRFGVQMNGRCLIADDMGLGKTFQALAIMHYYKTDWPLLIVTTATMKNVWEETIFKYLPSVSIMEVQYMVSGKDYIGSCSILIVSHDLMSRYCDKLLDRKFGCIIIDESHNLKNYKAKMTQAAAKLCNAAKRAVLLSGTPALSRPSELYSQLSMIDSKFFGSFIEYAKRYCDLQQTSFGLNSNGKSNLQELEIILRQKFMIRRRKEDVLGALPNKTQEIVKLDIDLKHLDKEDKEILHNLSTQFQNTDKSRDKHVILLTFFCETARIKIPAVCSHIQKVMETGKKFLVFAHHHVMLDAIETLLKHKAVNYIRIDGKTTGEQRKYFVDKFQTYEMCMCALLSITATNAGITLTAAQQVIFAELHWNPSILNQAEARAHRIGQENAVLIQYLLADGTSDDHIWPLLQEKQNILREMGLTKEKFSEVSHKYQYTSKNGLDDLFRKSSNDAKSVSKCDSSENMQTDEDSVLDDGLDDVLCNIDI